MSRSSEKLSGESLAAYLREAEREQPLVGRHPAELFVNRQGFPKPGTTFHLVLLNVEHSRYVGS